MRQCRRETATPAGHALTAADAALLSQQLAMDRLQHGAAMAALTHRAGELESQLAIREEELRQAHPHRCNQIIAQQMEHLT